MEVENRDLVVLLSARAEKLPPTHTAGAFPAFRLPLATEATSRAVSCMVISERSRAVPHVAVSHLSLEKAEGRS